MFLRAGLAYEINTRRNPITIDSQSNSCAKIVQNPGTPSPLVLAIHQGHEVVERNPPDRLNRPAFALPVIRLGEHGDDGGYIQVLGRGQRGCFLGRAVHMHVPGVPSQIPHTNPRTQLHRNAGWSIRCHVHRRLDALIL